MCPFEKSATAQNYLILVVHLGIVSMHSVWQRKKRPLGLAGGHSYGYISNKMEVVSNSFARHAFVDMPIAIH